MTLLLLLLLSLAANHCKAAHFHHRKRPPAKIIRNVSWKHIAAGGAAAGTVVAAYKISNGTEEGLKSAGKEAPAVFSFLTFSFLLLPLSAGAWIICRHLKRKE